MARRRAITIVLSVLGVVALVFVASVALVLVNVSRGPSIADDSTLVLKPAGALRETGWVGGRNLAFEVRAVRSAARRAAPVAAARHPRGPDALDPGPPADDHRAHRHGGPRVIPSATGSSGTSLDRKAM